MNRAYWLNSAWMWKCRRELSVFQRCSQSVAAAQAALLGEILVANRTSEFGRAHDFASIDSAAAFQRCVPLSTYENYRDAIARIGAGAANVLTSAPIGLFETTSGTSSGEKLIPYTAALRGQFQRAIDSWIADLFDGHPAARRGRAYWSISPAFGSRRSTSGGIPIGFDDDTAYLGGLEKFALSHLLAAPPALSASGDLDNFRYATLLYLVAADDLALVSIWSPTFLTAIVAELERWGERICRDLKDGTLTLPNPQADRALRLNLPHRKDVKRSARFDSILASECSLAEKLQRIWPKLALISCWADGSSSRYVSELQELFPTTEIQPKGLLATEGFVSLPLSGQPGAALAIRSHFFEFVEEDGTSVRLGHELRLGATYGVVITTGGGLYRYQLGDQVKVVGHLNQCPLLRFVGRAAHGCDLVGEKLNEAHVRAVLDGAFAAHRLTPKFSMLVPAPNGERYYCLYLQTANREIAPSEVESLRVAVEAGLRSNPYYAHALRLGQLSALRIQLLASTGETGWEIYERGCLARGQKLGDIKPASLHEWNGWHERFAPLTRSAA